ncbi:polyribonucleotide nucleotidyltransferase 1, mitochondrial isoform X1 [Pseudomyrmex gracilis]|uniref:polyribonucleotide nucleotidyltransferase 1, mitochondrial isoform X1 n=2 Tax=Pseudomyrmex gracilis TaxID=219809 RepID=UPI0009950CF8|nr:polyribonucleotide nucleotidyltransferase 1, mitochondrial isoform X1 [Pseudomyrmex gracilis]
MIVFTSSRLSRFRKPVFLACKSLYKNENVFYVRFSTNAGKEIATLSDGKQLILSTGKYARFADGSAVVSLGDTSVMVTAVSKHQSSSNSSFLPLVVDYRQKAAAAGRIPTNFLRRELGPTEREILTSRVIDRSIRPLFPEGFYFDTHVMCNMLAVDNMNDPDVIAINGASTALSVSDIPWDGPVGAVRVGMIDNDIIINPTRRQIQDSILNMIITATKHNLIVMIEGSANDILEQDLKKAIKLGVKECQTIVASITNLQKMYGKPKRKIEINEQDNDESLISSVKELAETKLREIFLDHTHDKISRDNAVSDVRNNVIETLKNDNANLNITLVEKIFGTISKDIFRQLILEKEIRCDGRSLTDLRNITCEVDLFNPLHGSAVFQRGQTQVMCTVTLDSLESALKMDAVSMLISGVKEKNFFLHYDFPPYATNETGRVGRIGRREMGHGALAEKALQPILPKDYPFAIRLTSEVLESNGSSSMATVCGGSLALMDAGVPISSPAAGVAIGLVTRYNETKTDIEDYKILTDILGIEDYLGDMDFKIAGTKRAFTALQADVKIPGVPLKIIMECIHQATVAKSEILKLMNNVLREPRSTKRDKMPIVENIQIPIHQRGKFLGVGGINLKKILLETGVHINPHDEETYYIFAPNESAMAEAKEMIENILQKDREPTLEFGGIYKAKIVEIRETGVMVTLYSNMVPTFLPNSQLDQCVIHHPSALGLEIGHEIKVKYFGRDPVSGQIRLSRKVLQQPTKVVRSLHREEENG